MSETRKDGIELLTNLLQTAKTETEDGAHNSALSLPTQHIEERDRAAVFGIDGLLLVVQPAGTALRLQTNFRAASRLAASDSAGVLSKSGSNGVGSPSGKGRFHPGAILSRDSRVLRSSGSQTPQLHNSNGNNANNKGARAVPKPIVSKTQTGIEHFLQTVSETSQGT
eukprot:6477964-Amphidinium_carterae.1